MNEVLQNECLEGSSGIISRENFGGIHRNVWKIVRRIPGRISEGIPRENFQGI